MSVVITLNLDTITPRSAKALSLALASMSDPMEVTVTGKNQVNIAELQIPEGGAKEPVDPTPITPGAPVDPAGNEESVTTASVPSEPKTRKPRAKKEGAGEPVDPTPQTGPQPSPSTSLETTNSAGSAPSSEPPTIDALRAGLQAKKDKSGMQAAIDLLGDFGCARITEVAALPVEKQTEFLGKCNA